MKLQFLGHACFLLDDGSHKVLIDPFLTGNPLAAATADAVEADTILLSHGHDDHVGDARAIAGRTGAAICCTVDLAAGLGLDAVTGNLGGWLPMPFGQVKFVPAIHGSGVAGCLSCGFLIEIGGKRIYHAGDTALTMDMALLKEEAVDAALLPIGDVYTMGPADALRAAELIRPALVIPMHYNTFPLIAQDGAAFVAEAERRGIPGRQLAPGDTLDW